MYIYIGCLAIIFILYIVLYKVKYTKYSKLIFCLSIFILFTLIQGLRSQSVGIDTEKYIKYYGMSKNISFTQVMTKEILNFEQGFGLLMQVLASSGLPVQVFFIAVAVIINGGVCYFIYKNSENPLLSVILFMGIEFFTLSFTALRQMMALAIAINAYPFIKKGKPIKFAIIVLIASLFHQTALIFLIAYLFRYIKINNNTIILGGIIFLVMQVFGFDIFVTIGRQIYPYYIEQNIVFSTQGIIQAVVILIYLILGFFIYYIQRKQKNININDYNVLFVCMFVAFLTQSFTNRITMINRLMWYFYIYLIIFLPNLIAPMENKRNKSILNWMCIGLGLVQYLVFSMSMYNVVPYEFLIK